MIQMYLVMNTLEIIIKITKINIHFSYYNYIEIL